MADVIEKDDLFGDFNLNPEIKALETLLALVGQLKKEIAELAKLKILDVKNIDPATIEGLKQLAKEKENVEKITKRHREALTEEERLSQKLNQLYTEQAKVNADLKLSIQQKNKLLKEQAVLGSTTASLYDKERTRLDKLAKSYKDLVLAGKQNTAQAKQTIKDFTDLKKKVEEADTSVGNHRDNVGNYRSALEGLSPAFGRASGAANTFGSALFKLVKNPFIALIVAASAALGGLLAAFKSTDEGAVKFEGLMKGIGNVLEVLRLRAVTLASAFADLIRFDLVSAQVKLALAFGGVGEAMKKAFEAGLEYAEVLDKIADAETAFISQRAINENRIAKLDFLAKDPSKTTRERVDALKELLEIAREQAEEEERIAVDRYNAEVELFAKTKGLDADKIKQAIESSRDTGVLSKKFSDEEIKNLEELFAKTKETNTKLFEETKKKNAQLQKFLLELDEEFRKELKIYDDKFAELLKKYKKDADDFIKENERKELAAKKFADDLIDLEIDNLSKQGELAEDEAIKEEARFQRELENLERNSSDAIKKTKEFQVAKELLEKEHQKNLDAINQKAKEKAIKDLETGFNLYKDFQNKRLDERNRVLDVELSNSEKQEDALRELAAQRVLYADESLAIELQKQKDIEIEKQKIARRQALLDATSAAIQLMGNYAKGGSQQPFEDAFRDITSMLAALKSVQFLAEGTESVEGGTPGKDSVPAMLMPKEKVFSVEDSQKIGYDISNSEVADIVRAYKDGAFNHVGRVGELAITRREWETNSELLARVESMEKYLKEISQKPVQRIDPHALAGFITERMIMHNKTERTHYKNSNIFS